MGWGTHPTDCLNQWIIDLSQKKLALKSSITYDKNGNVLTNSTYGDCQLEWSPIVPNSNAEFWLELIKKPRLLKKMYKMQKENMYVDNTTLPSASTPLTK